MLVRGGGPSRYSAQELLAVGQPSHPPRGVMEEEPPHIGGVHLLVLPDPDERPAQEMAHLGVEGHAGDTLGDRPFPVGHADELLPLEGEEPEAAPLPLGATAVSAAPRGEEALRFPVDLIEAT